MNNWSERVLSHPFLNNLGAIVISLDDALSKGVFSSAEFVSLERLKAVLKYCEGRLRSADPFLIGGPVFENLNGVLVAVKNSLDAFLAGSDVSHLVNANGNADNLLVLIAQVPSISNIGELSEMITASTNYQGALENQLQIAFANQISLEKKLNGNVAKIDAIDAALIAEQQKLAALIPDHLSQFSAAQDRRATEFTATQNAFVQKSVSSLAEQQTAFSTDQDARKTAYAETERGIAAKVTKLISDFDLKLQIHDEDYIKKEKLADETHIANMTGLQIKYQRGAEDILDQMRTHKTEIEALVGVIGNLGVTSGYKKVADEAKKLQYIWQIVTIGALAGLIGVAMWIAWPKSNAEVLSVNKISQNVVAGGATAVKSEPELRSISPSHSETDNEFYHGLATRIFLSITFGIFAAYAGKQASHFSEVEQRNRKLALELEALGPFIEPLEKLERDKFRVQIGDRSFGVPSRDDGKPKESDPVSILGIVGSKETQKAVFEWITELAKKIKP